MYPQHIQEAAAAMGRTLTESATPLYGSGLRLPDRRAVIDLVKEVRRLLFPAYFGDPALMSLDPENYAALLLERISEKLTAQLRLALPEDQVQRAEEITREFVRRLPGCSGCCWRTWTPRLSPIPPLRPGRRSSLPIRACSPSLAIALPTCCTASGCL